MLNWVLVDQRKRDSKEVMLVPPETEYREISKIERIAKGVKIIIYLFWLFYRL